MSLSEAMTQQINQEKQRYESATTPWRCNTPILEAYIQPVDSDVLEESNCIRVDVTNETEMQQLSSQEDAMSDSSEATLPSSETDAILAIEYGCGPARREEDELSASSEATLPSSEAEALQPRPEEVVEVRMEVEPEPSSSAKSPRRLSKDGISHNRKGALSSTKVIEWQINSLSTNPNSPSASKSADAEVAETEGNSVQMSQGGSYPCARCRRTFWSRPNLDAHARVHSGERPFCCAGCGRCFAQACHLRNHEIAAHGRPATPRAFACPACGCAFGRQGALALHMRVHANAQDAPGDDAGDAVDAAATPPPPPPPPPPRPAGPVTCDVCGKTLSHRCSLARHMRTHSGEPRPRPHRCGGCGAAFGTAPQLADHERRRHTGERPFACARCGRRFHSRAHLKYHERAHDPARPFRCDFCLKAFMSQFGLTRHRRVHTGDFRYKCEECPDAFVSRGQLLAHARNHAGDERPFKCPLCTASFVQRGLLTLHLRKHTGEQPFRCATCAHDFPHRRLLVAHQAVCHKVSQPSPAPAPAPAPVPAGTAATHATEEASGCCASATSAADGEVPVAEMPLAPANGGMAESSVETKPLIKEEESCGMEDSSPASPANVSTITAPTLSTPSTTVAPIAHHNTRPLPTSTSVSVLTMTKPSSRTAAVPPSIPSVTESIPCSMSSTSTVCSPTTSSSKAPTTPPRPRLLLVTVKTPEKLRHEWGEQSSPKVSASELTKDNISILQEEHRDSDERLTSEEHCHNMSHLAAIVKSAACLGDINNQVIVKIEDEQYPVETFLQTCGHDVNFQCERLLNDSTSVTNIINIEANEDEHERSFKNDTSQWPFESIERTGEVIVKSEEDTIIGSPLSEVVIKVSESDDVIHDIASRSLQEYKAVFKPKIVRVDHAPKSLRNLPVQIEQQDKGDSWPTWPTAVVTIEIENTDNDI